MEAILLILVIAFIVFVAGIYADSGSKESNSNSKHNIPSIEYYMVNKK